MKKRFLTIVLAFAAMLCLCFGLSACRKDKDKVNSGNGGTQTEQPDKEHSGSQGGNPGGSQTMPGGGTQTPSEDSKDKDNGSSTQKPEDNQDSTQKPDEGQGGNQTPDDGNQGTNTPIPSPHTHSYSSLWSSDEENHWHAATCNHNVKQDEAPHTYVNGVCTTCKHAHANHTFGGYTSNDETHAHTCTVCHKTESATHTYQNGVCSTCNHAHANHSFDSYTSNDENHTHVCSVCHKTETGSHTYANGVCSACNHVHANHTFGGYTSNDETHAHTCTVCHKMESATHTYVNGVCSTCNHAHENHVYGNWVDDTLASETQTGSRHKDCFCGNRVTEETPKITAFEFEQSGNGYAVTAYTGSLTELIVPAEHEGKPVTAIAGKAFYDGEFTSIKLPTSLKEIGENAFGYCTKLQSIEIPNCARIENSAFVGCAALQEITLPADNIFLGVSLFDYCSALEKVTVKGGTVQSATFSGAETVKEMILEEGVKSIAQGAFASCKNLQKLTLPRVDTTSSFMRYYFNVTPKIYTMSRTEDGSEISDLYPDEVVSHQYGNHIFSLPKDYTDWYYDGKTIEVDGTVYTYDGKPIKVSSWKKFYDITANTYWYGPKSWSATFYYFPETALEKLTITNQLVSVYDKIFEECACDIDIWEKFPITTLSVKGATECYIDEFSQENYKLHVEYADGFKEDFPLFDHISAEDQAALRTVGEHEITAHYQDKSCTATINVRLHTFDEAILESAEHIYDGSAFSLEVTGAPEGTDIAYTGNGQSDVGEYTVTATLTKPYYETKTLTATLNILKQRYEISYDLGLENVANDNPSDYETNGENIKLKDPVRPGWGFVGWYTEAEFQNIITEIKGNAHKDYTLYAKWQTVFTLSGGQITGLNDYGKQQTELIIDETIDGTRITSIGERAFYDNTKLQKITIPSGVTSIGRSAFSGCSGLKEVHITDLSAWCRINFDNSSANPLCCAHHLYVGDAEVKILEIPTDIKNYAFYGCSGLESVTIGSGATSIGNSAFYGCSGLESVTIGSGATSIGSSAFYNCRRLTSVTIGIGVTSIGDEAFYGTAYYNDNNNWDESGVLYIGNYLIKAKTTISGNYLMHTNTKLIADRAFYNCSGLTSVTIGSGVTSIGDWAFYGCNGLESVIWNAENCTRAGSYSNSNRNNYTIFRNCTNLNTVTFGKNVKTIPAYAFYGCNGLTGDLKIPDSVTSIGYKAFSGCSGLTGVYITDLAAWCRIDFGPVDANPLSYAHHLYLDGNEVKDLTIPSDIKEIKAYAFYNCNGLTSVTIGNGVASIGSYAFRSCSGLTSVTIGSGVTSIGELAFYDCYKLIEVWNHSTLSIVPGDSSYGYVARYAKTVYQESESSRQTVKDGYLFYEDGEESCLFGYIGEDTDLTLPVTSPSGKKYVINQYAFYRCDWLTSVTISDSVTSIGYEAFYDCDGLTSVTIGSGVTSIGDYAFWNCISLESVMIGSGVTSIGSHAFEGTAYYNDNSNWDKSGVLYIGNYLIKAKTTISGSYTIRANTKVIAVSAFYGCSGLTSVTIGSGVTLIGESAFSRCSGLTGITIPDSVTSIGGYAFSGCSGLTSVTIPDSVTSIGSHAFEDCSGLTSITIPDSVTSIGGYAFYGCSGLTSITIPDSVTSIGYGAFENCSGLTSIEIPDSVTSIGWSAFEDCKGLTSATIGSGVTTIGYAAFSGCSGLKEVHITDLAAWCRIDFGSSSANPLYYAHHLYLDGAEIENLTIPSEIKEIKDYAFYGCSGLESVTIGSGVTSIGSCAFVNCDRLTKIQYNGTIAAWELIKKGYAWNQNAGNYIVYCTDGTITKDGKETYYSNAQSVSAFAAIAPRKREF